MLRRHHGALTVSREPLRVGFLRSVIVPNDEKYRISPHVPTEILFTCLVYRFRLLVGVDAIEIEARVLDEA